MIKPYCLRKGEVNKNGENISMYFLSIFLSNWINLTEWHLLWQCQSMSINVIQMSLTPLNYHNRKKNCRELFLPIWQWCQVRYLLASHHQSILSLFSFIYCKLRNICNCELRLKIIALELFLSIFLGWNFYTTIHTFFQCIVYERVC